MFEGVKPLDLSFLRSKPLNLNEFGGTSIGGQTSPNLQSIAKVISGNTDWNAIKANLDKEKTGSPQEPTFWGGLMDLLSSGNYAVANGIEGMIKGAHSGKGDSLDSYLKTLGGGVTGALEGLGAGITSGVSAMTGTNDDVARDQFGKTRFADLIQEHTPLGVKQNPETGEFVQNGEVISKGNAENRSLANGLFGLTGDIFLDPLTYVGGGLIPKGAKIAKAIETGGDSLKTSLATAEELKGLKGIGKESTPVADEVNPLVEQILNKSAGHIPAADKSSKFAPVADEADPFASMLSDMASKGELSAAKFTADGKKIVDLTEDGGDVGRMSLPTPSIADSKKISRDSLVHPDNQQKLASKLGQFIAIGPDSKSVVKNVFEWLGSKHREIDFPRVESYMEKLRGQADPKFFKLMQTVPEFRKRVIGGLHEAVKADVANSGLKASGVKSASEIIDDIATGADTAKFGSIGKMLDASDSMILGKVLDKYKNSIETGIFHSAKDPEALASAIQSGTNHKWTGPTQINVWNSLLHNLNGSGKLKYTNPKSRYTKALQMLREFEDHYISQGHTPYSAFKASESVPLRLSEVISHIGTQNFAKHADDLTTVLRSAFSGGELKGLDKLTPELAHVVEDAIERGKAGAAVAESGLVEDAIQKGSNVAKTILSENAASKAAIADAIESIQKATRDLASGSGASLNGAKMAGQWVKDAYEIKDPVGSAISSSKLHTMTALSGVTDKGVLSLKFSNAPKVTTAIGKQLGPITQAANKVGPLAKAEEWLGARFNAAYKNADMRPVYLSNMASAKATVSLRAKQVNSLVRTFGKDGDLWHEAMQSAQGKKFAATGEQKALGQEIQKVMEDLFGGSGLRKGAEFENTVVGRAQLLRKELNANLKKFGLPYQFTNAKEYRSGTDWMKSWESWDVKNPLQMIYQVQNAVEMTVRTRSMFDEVISRFGSYTSKPGYTTKIAPGLAKEFPYLAQAHFSPEMAEQANNFLKMFKEINQPSSKLVQQLDNIMGKWKSSVTIYRPAHYWRNLVGDLTFNWLAGVDSTRAYTTARKVMQSQKGKYDWETGSLSDLTGPDALKKAMQGGASAVGPVGSNVALTMKNGKKVTNDMLYIAAFQKGILPSARVLEDLPDKVPSFLDKMHLPGKLEGRGQEAVHKLHEQRDHFVRLAHFTDVLSKSRKPFEQAVDEAAQIVRKWHPDGMDLTAFERNKMRRVFPFYSWSRKAIPLALESVYTKPGKVMLYPKLQYGAQSAIMGPNAGTSMADPFPEDQLWPDWMREKGIGPLFGEAGNYTFLNPSNPIQDLAAQFGDVPRMLGNGFSSRGVSGLTTMVNPLAKIPAELMTGTNTMTGAPIKDWTQYATMQVPGVSDLSRVSNVDLGGASPVAEQQGFGNTDAILNYLTALGIKNTTPKDAVSGQFAMRDYLKRLKENG
jgi:hypothetical protein